MSAYIPSILLALAPKGDVLVEQIRDLMEANAQVNAGGSRGGPWPPGTGRGNG